MSKQTKTIISIIICLIIAVGCGILAVKLSPGYFNHLSPEARQGCAPQVKDHKVVIQNDKVSPEYTTAPKCDMLTITNLDNKYRLIAFGPHDNHVPYDEVTERLLSKGQSFTVTLNQTGTFSFHDHLHDEVQGTFTVTD